MKRSYLLFLTAFAFWYVAKGQQISFQESVYDFGQFPESEGQVSHEFTFINSGDAPLVLTRVSASCGCTTPEWSKEPISPGKSGKIKITYNATNRPGVFNKSITIYSNSKKGAHVLNIKGSVTAKKVEPEEQFPVKMGDLWLKTKSLMFNDVGKNEEKTAWIEVTNAGKNPLSLNFENVAPYLYIQANPDKLSPNQVGMIFVTFFGKKINDWGNIRTQFQINTGNGQPSQADRTITIDVKVVERFNSSENAPKMVFSDAVVNMGKVNAREKKSQKVSIQNRGKADLIIRKMTSSTDALVVSLDKTTIPPNESATLRVMVDSRKLQGSAIRERIDFITNDPAVVNTSIQVVGEIR